MLCAPGLAGASIPNPGTGRNPLPNPMHHALLLQRVGAVLCAAGLAALAATVFGLASRMAYAPGLGLLAVVAGVFLLRGSLRAAALVRWCAVFLLAGSVALLFFLPFMQPFSLTFAQLRLHQGPSWSMVAGVALGVGLAGWIAWALGREPIRAARIGAGQKCPDMRIAALAGVGLIVALGLLMVVLRDGPALSRAKSMAEQQAGPDYRLHIRALNVNRSSKGAFVSGVVTAWNDNEIRHIPVQWEER